MIDIIITIIVIIILYSIIKINNDENITNNDDNNINNDNNIIAYLCEYINTAPIEINNNDEKLIVGDVHGSILQLFLPLRQAGINIKSDGYLLW